MLPASAECQSPNAIIAQGSAAGVVASGNQTIGQAQRSYTLCVLCVDLIDLALRLIFRQLCSNAPDLTASLQLSYGGHSLRQGLLIAARAERSRMLAVRHPDDLLCKFGVLVQASWSIGARVNVCCMCRSAGSAWQCAAQPSESAAVHHRL